MSFVFGAVVVVVDGVVVVGGGVCAVVDVLFVVADVFVVVVNVVVDAVVDPVVCIGCDDDVVLTVDVKQRISLSVYPPIRSKKIIKLFLNSILSSAF